MAKFCKMCGQQMEDEDCFCDACGAKYVNNEENIENLKFEEMSKFKELEDNIEKCTTCNDLKNIQPDVENKITDSYDRQYLLGLIEEKYRTYSKVEYTEKIASCKSIDEAIDLRKEIDKEKHLLRDRYWLLRMLKERMKTVYSDVIELGRNAPREYPVRSFIKSEIPTVVIYILCKLISRVDIKLIHIIAIWGSYFALFYLIVTAIYWGRLVIKWKNASKEEKEAGAIVDLLKFYGLYIDEKEFIFYDSDIRYIEDINLSEEHKQYAYMEILARHGKKYYQPENVQKWFEGKSWYSGLQAREVDIKELNKYEVANYNLLRDNNPKVTIEYVD